MRSPRIRSGNLRRRDDEILGVLRAAFSTRRVSWTSTPTGITTGLHPCRVGEELVETLLAGIAAAAERIDLRARRRPSADRGCGRRSDSAPGAEADRPLGRRRFLPAERVGHELGLPVFFYGRLTGDGREPAFFRRSGPEGSSVGSTSVSSLPTAARPASSTAGGVLVGVRRPLVAFNVNLRSDDVAAAREIAALIRERDGGFPGVRALGLDLPRAGLVQVSMNVTDWQAARLYRSSAGSRPRRSGAASRSSARSWWGSCRGPGRRGRGRAAQDRRLRAGAGAGAPPARG